MSVEEHVCSVLSVPQGPQNPQALRRLKSEMKRNGLVVIDPSALMDTRICFMRLYKSIVNSSKRGIGYIS